MTTSSSRMRNFLQKAWLWVIIVVLSAGFWGIMFYWAAQPSAEEKFEIWVGAPTNLQSEIIDEIEVICAKGGMKKCTVTNYNPQHSFYGAAFGLRSTAIDIFVLAKQQADQIAEAGIFQEMTGKYANFADGYTYADVTYGVKFVGEYYVFVNSKCNKNQDLIFAVIDLLISHGDNQ